MTTRLTVAVATSALLLSSGLLAAEAMQPPVRDITGKPISGDLRTMLLTKCRAGWKPLGLTKMRYTKGAKGARWLKVKAGKRDRVTYGSVRYLDAGRRTDGQLLCTRHGQWNWKYILPIGDGDVRPTQATMVVAGYNMRPPGQPFALAGDLQAVAGTGIGAIQMRIYDGTHSTRWQSIDRAQAFAYGHVHAKKGAFNPYKSDVWIAWRATDHDGNVIPFLGQRKMLIEPENARRIVGSRGAVALTHSVVGDPRVLRQ